MNLSFHHILRILPSSGNSIFSFILINNLIYMHSYSNRFRPPFLSLSYLIFQLPLSKSINLDLNTTSLHWTFSHWSSYFTLPFSHSQFSFVLMLLLSFSQPSTYQSISPLQIFLSVNINITIIVKISEDAGIDDCAHE